MMQNIPLDFEQLVDKESMFIKKIEKEYTVLLHPMYMMKPKEGVAIELDSLLDKYSIEFGGIVMRYDCVKITSLCGLQIHTNPYLHIPVKANFYVFSPVVGDIIEGTVKKRSNHHVGCLIHGRYNFASYYPEKLETEWLGSHVVEGNVLKLKINYIDLKSRAPFFKGDIMSICNNSKHKMFNNEEEDSGISSAEKQSKHQKKKKSNLSDANNEGIETLKGKKLKKKSLCNTDDTFYEESTSNSNSFLDTTLDGNAKTKKKKDETVYVKQEIETSFLVCNDTPESPKKKHKRKRSQSNNNAESELGLQLSDNYASTSSKRNSNNEDFVEIKNEPNEEINQTFDICTNPNELNSKGLSDEVAICLKSNNENIVETPPKKSRTKEKKSKKKVLDEIKSIDTSIDPKGMKSKRLCDGVSISSKSNSEDIVNSEKENLKKKLLVKEIFDEFSEIFDNTLDPKEIVYKRLNGEVSKSSKSTNEKIVETLKEKRTSKTKKVKKETIEEIINKSFESSLDPMEKKSKSKRNSENIVETPNEKHKIKTKIFKKEIIGATDLGYDTVISPKEKKSSKRKRCSESTLDDRQQKRIKY